MKPGTFISAVIVSPGFTASTVLVQEAFTEEFCVKSFTASNIRVRLPWFVL
jgi:hypothetical protein